MKRSVGSVCARTGLKGTCCEMEMRGMVRNQKVIFACELIEISSVAMHSNPYQA